MDLGQAEGLTPQATPTRPRVLDLADTPLATLEVGADHRQAGHGGPLASPGVYAGRNDARYPGRVTVHYPLHPLFGQELPVFREHQLGGTEQIELQIGDQRRQAIPVWMTHENRCAGLTFGLEPVRSTFWVDL